jgi:hypothetical protein
LLKCIIKCLLLIFPISLKRVDTWRVKRCQVISGREALWWEGQWPCPESLCLGPKSLSGPCANDRWGGKGSPKSLWRGPKSLSGPCVNDRRGGKKDIPNPCVGVPNPWVGPEPMTDKEATEVPDTKDIPNPWVERGVKLNHYRGVLLFMSAKRRLCAHWVQGEVELTLVV